LREAVENQSQIVIGPDGVVLAATGAPPGIVDLHLEDCNDLAPEIRDAGKALVQELRGSAGRVVGRTVTLEGSARSVQLVAIEALAIRRIATDVRELLLSKLAVIASQAAAVDVTLTVEAADNVPPVVRLDAEKIAWAVTTLVGNALRYMRPGLRRFGGGTIDVRTGYDATRSEITIEVRDDGPGIPADTVARLFRRDGLNVRGAGLALLLISEITAAHGGRVDVRSHTDPVEHGTTVRLAFPVR
jgi:two-component system, NtrC family, sensor histidine kinase KinB